MPRMSEAIPFNDANEAKKKKKKKHKRPSTDNTLSQYECQQNHIKSCEHIKKTDISRHKIQFKEVRTTELLIMVAATFDSNPNQAGIQAK